MIGIERIDIDLFQSSHLFFRDDGPVTKGAKTRQFSVISKTYRNLLGYIKWYRHWRKYCFYPLNSLFDNLCLEEVALFCVQATKAHKSRLPNKQRLKNLEKAKRQRRIEKLAKEKEKLLKKDLTESENTDTVDSVEEIEESINPLVEGDQEQLTPLEEYLVTIEV